MPSKMCTNWSVQRSRYHYCWAWFMGRCSKRYHWLSSLTQNLHFFSLCYLCSWTKTEAQCRDCITIFFLTLLDAVIVGLKELPEGDYPLVHSHIFFAHIYKVLFDVQPRLLVIFFNWIGSIWCSKNVQPIQKRRRQVIWLRIFSWWYWKKNCCFW